MSLSEKGCYAPPRAARTRRAAGGRLIPVHLTLALALAAGSAPAPAPAPSAAPRRPASIDVPLPPPPDLRPVARPAARPAPARALRVAVPDLKLDGELPARQRALVEGALLAELRKLEGVSAIGMSEIREMLSFEYQRQMMGCSADEACLAEIGGALGTDELLAGSVVVSGKSVTLTLRRIAMRTARVTGSDTRRLVRADGEELLGAVGPAIQTVFAERTVRAGAVRGVGKEVALLLNPPPLPRWPFAATATASALAFAGAGAFAYLARDARQQYASLADRALGEPVSGAQLAELERSVSSRSRNANLLLLAGGGLAAAAGVEALFTDWHGYRASLALAPGQAMLRVGAAPEASR